MTTLSFSAPVKAIKEGKDSIAYDIWYFYGQLNSNQIKWFYDKVKIGSEKIRFKRKLNPETGDYRLIKTDFDQKSKGVGRAVLTANPRSFGYPLDLTNEYKGKPDEECSNHIRSMKTTGLMERKERIQLLSKSVDQQSNVEFTVKEVGFFTYGQDIELEVQFNNKSENSRYIKFSVRVHSQQPNGRLIAQINSFQDRIKLNPYESESLKLFTPISDYSKHTTTHNSLIAIVSASVEGFSDLFYHEEKFRISGSAIAIISQSIGQINEPLIAIVTVRNHSAESLTNTILLLHSGKPSHASKIERFPREIHPGQRVKLQIRFCPTQLGYRFLVAEVNSTQIKHIQAVHLFKSVEAH